MPVHASDVLWLLLALGMGVFLEWNDAQSLHILSSVSDAYALSLPANVSFEGTVSNIRFSRLSVVFEMENKGIITCYFRHPPETFFLFSGERILVRGKIEQTPQGRLCVVREVGNRDSP